MQEKNKKKLTINEIETSVLAAHEAKASASAPAPDKTSVKFNKRGKKKIKHLKLYIVLGVLGVVLSALVYFGWTLYGSLSKSFAGDAPNLLNLLTTTQLKGESTGRINVLLLGVGDAGHSGENLSDTIMVVSYDVKTKQAAMISVPRDLYVKIATYGSSKINAAHAYGEYYKYSGGGPALSAKVVSQVLGIPIHYYARVDFTGLKEIVDAVGGIDIAVKEDLYDPYYPADDGLKSGALYIKKGTQHMNGTTALRYSRSRETTSDFDRARRQQQVLVAVKDKVMSSSTLLNPSQIERIAAAVGTHFKTDFSLNEIPHGLDLFKNVDSSKIKHLGFDNSAAGLLIDDSSTAAGYILIPRLGMYNYSALQAAAANIFTTSSTVTSEAATVTVLNGTSTSGLANKAATALKKVGISITAIATADSSGYSQTKVLDYSGGTKSATTAAITKTLGVGAVTKMSGDSPYGSDITVVIGSDYK